MTKLAAIQKKISVKTVFGTVNAAVIAKHENADENGLHVMSIMGIASGVKSGATNFGDWRSLAGQFRAINPHTGETFMSANAFLPDVALDLVIGAVANGSTIEFAFNIYAVLDDRSPVGFSYRAVPLMKQEHDPMKALEDKLVQPLALEVAKKAEIKAAKK